MGGGCIVVHICFVVLDCVSMIWNHRRTMSTYKGLLSSLRGFLCKLMIWCGGVFTVDQLWCY